MDLLNIPEEYRKVILSGYSSIVLLFLKFQDYIH